MNRTFDIDVRACACGGRLKLLRFVTRQASIEKILRSLGEPTEVPGLAPARDPPSYKSRVVRRRSLDERCSQREASGSISFMGGDGAPTPARVDVPALPGDVHDLVTLGGVAAVLCP